MFSGCNKLNTITLPEGVKILKPYALANLPKLTSMKLPNSVKKIGENAFAGCNSLKSFSFGSGIKNLPAGIFGESNDNITTITIPSGVTGISNYAFMNLTSLQSIELPTTLKSIGDSAFQNCTSLTTIVMPDKVNKVGNGAFYGCRMLSSVKLSSSLSYISAELFTGCASLSTIAIPDGITTLHEGAFGHCVSLKSVDLPESLSVIESSVFAGCYKLTSIDLPRALTSIGSYAFNDCSSLTTLTLHRGINYIGDNAFSKCMKLVCQVFEDSYAHERVKELKCRFKLIDDTKPTATPTVAPTPTPTTKPTSTPTQVVDISECTISRISDQTYTGSWVRPIPVIKYGTTTLTLDKDYSLTYSDNADVGQATITIKGLGEYTGTAHANFNIIPWGTRLSSLSKGSKRFTAKWSKQSNITGYQLQYSTSSSFSNAKSVTINKASTVKKTVKSLKKSTKYYVRIRTYKTVGGKKYYSVWSAAKSVKTK